LRNAYPGPRLLIVSNSAGTNDDIDGKEAKLLEDATGVEVLRHSTKKPGCGAQVLEHFRKRPGVGVTKPSQIAVVGDRLFTDVTMASQMGAWSIWVRDGIVVNDGAVSQDHLVENMRHTHRVKSSLCWRRQFPVAFSG